MLSREISIEAVCESSILINFAEEISPELPLFINQVAELVYANHNGSIMNITPSYTTLLVDYLPYRTPEHVMLKSLAQIVHQVDSNDTNTVTNTVILPVYYGFDVAPDLQRLIQDKSIELEQLVAKHTAPLYSICAIGFAPGFAFLSGLDSSLATPRHATPRLKVASGSVGIADNQTAVYPSATPGGWNIIGNCPTRLFDPSSEQLSPFRIGDKVKFESISKQEYLKLGGQLWAI
ncbi:5-oxoprolinase subunit B family protein [Vibrio algarum]|uniref:Carboxyltransferase domain-containing protein n=1 Tax=Vibrio algarum TaxID=3020714 RepID=A0ABT4YXI3_9VIBR|nr:carboxyltransferase domain-containing protein [Vibrio sp. KJ40-1]MDB1126293.1 carboxyltransferase domain-containing protein [Vibrio sp. KJ40-1]